MSTATKNIETVSQAVQARRDTQRREALECYRGFVRKTHEGKKLNEADMAKVVDAMNLLGIPTEAIDADVTAWDRHLKYRESLANFSDRRNKYEADMRRLTTEINETQTKLRQLERDHRVVMHEGKSIFALEAQANEHVAKNPRMLVDDIERALGPVPVDQPAAAPSLTAQLVPPFSMH